MMEISIHWFVAACAGLFMLAQAAVCPRGCTYTPFDETKGLCNCTGGAGPFNFCPDGCPYLSMDKDKCVDENGQTCLERKLLTREDISRDCFCDPGAQWMTCTVVPNVEFRIGENTGIVEYRKHCAESYEAKLITHKGAGKTEEICECCYMDEEEEEEKCTDMNEGDVFTEFDDDSDCKNSIVCWGSCQCLKTPHKFEYDTMRVNLSCGYEYFKKEFAGGDLQADCNCDGGDLGDVMYKGDNVYALNSERQPDCGGQCLVHAGITEDRQCKEKLRNANAIYSFCNVKTERPNCECTVMGASLGSCEAEVASDIAGRCWMDGDSGVDICYFIPTKGGVYEGKKYTEGVQALCPAGMSYNTDCTCSVGASIVPTEISDSCKTMVLEAGMHLGGGEAVEGTASFSFIGSEGTAIIILIAVAGGVFFFWTKKKGKKGKGGESNEESSGSSAAGSSSNSNNNNAQ